MEIVGEDGTDVAELYSALRDNKAHTALSPASLLSLPHPDRLSSFALSLFHCSRAEGRDCEGACSRPPPRERSPLCPFSNALARLLGRRTDLTKKEVLARE